MTMGASLDNWVCSLRGSRAEHQLAGGLGSPLWGTTLSFPKEGSTRTR